MSPFVPSYSIFTRSFESFRWICLLLVLSTCSLSVFAGKETRINSLNGSGITNSATVTVKDQHYDYMASQPNTWPQRFGIERSQIQARLWFDDARRDYYGLPWEVTVDYDIEVWKWDAVTFAFTSVTYPGSMTINYTPTGGYEDLQLLVYDGYLRARLTVNNITTNGVNTVPEDLYLDLESTTERYYFLGSNEAPVMTSQTVLAPTNELRFSWNFIEGAESYDVEYVFIDVPEAPLNSGFDFDWRDATRVNVPENHFQFSLSYPRGVFVYRTRAVGRNPNDFSDWIEANWSLDPFLYENNTGSIGQSGGNGTGFPQKPQMYFHQGHDLDMNWQYSTTWSEDGKRKEAISYFDGTMRSRQTSTIVNSDNNAVVASSIYDYYGRPVIGLLPAPQTNQGMQFYPKQAMVNNVNYYSWHNFDLDSKVFANDPIDKFSSKGAANYYSPENNQDYGPLNDYLPDAKERPFTRTLYSNDGTGRPKIQAGVGETHQMGSDREVKYWYGTPTGQAELDRLFGNEVGFANHYKKQLMMDANKQVSITYTDLKGRTIATALAGDEPDNLLAIDTKPSNFPLVTSNLNTFNQLSEDGREWALRNTFLVSDAGSDYTFSYSLDGESFCHQCFVCKECKYDLYIALKDEYNNKIQLTWTGPTTTNGAYVNGMSYDEIYLTDITSFTAPSIGLEASNLSVGSYSIDKVLSINQQALDAYLLELEDPMLQSCYSVQTVSATCDPCSTWCEAQHIFVDNQGRTVYLNENGDPVARFNPNLNPPAYDLGVGNEASEANAVNIAVADCQANCNIDNGFPIDPCAFQLTMLQQDMSPDGQYFDHLPNQLLADGISTNPNYDQNGWLDNATVGSQSLFDWFMSIGGITCNSCSNWDDVRAQWQSSWADVLVQQHPEYCHWLSRCGGCKDENIGLLVTTEQLDAYYVDLMNANPDYFSGNAVNASEAWFNPINLPAQTVANGQHHTYQPFDFTSGVQSHDPAFLCNIDNHEEIQTALLQWLPRVTNPTGPSDYFTLWYVLEDPGQIAQSNGQTNLYNVTLSQEAQDVFNELHGDGTNPGLIGTNPGQLSHWEFFKAAYLMLRERTQYNDANANCGNHFESPSPDGYMIRFPENTIFENWDNLSASFLTTQSEDQCQDACIDFVNVWMQQHQGCYNPAQAATIANELIAVCKLGCADDGIGSSSGDGTAIGGPSAATTFQEVLNYYSVSGYGCDAPSYPTQVYDQPACQCDGINDLLTGFYLDNGINLGTDPAVLSGALQVELTEELEELLTTGESFPNILASFLGWYDNCQDGIPNTGIMSALACGADQGLATIPTPSCDAQLTALLQYDALQLYNEQIKQLKKEYETQYIAHCMSGLMTRENFEVAYTPKEYHYTLFYYDQAGNLIKTVPPQAVYDHLHLGSTVDLFEEGNTTPFTVADVAEARNSGYTTKPFLHPQYELITNYRHNSRQNITQKHTPDGGEIKMWYDGLNRIVASQNAKQKATVGQYSYATYDALSRAIESGEINGAGIPAQFHYLTLGEYQNWLTNATGNRTQVTRSFFDQTVSSTINNQFSSGQQNLRNRVATSAYYDEYQPGITAITGYTYASHYSYDIHGNSNELVQQNNELADLGQEFKKIAYQYDLISGKVNEVHYQPGEYDELYHRYCYDADNRMTEMLTSKDGKIWERDKKYFFYAHGPIARIETGSEQVQGSDYAYNLHGWLKSINASTGRADLDPGQDGNAPSNIHQQFGQDAMGFSLHYHQNDYEKISSSSVAPDHLIATTSSIMNQQSPDLYNGNISKMVTALTNTQNQALPVFGNAYRYDQLNRIRQYQSYYDISSTDQDNARELNSLSTSSFNNKYAGEYHYDGNGNLTILKRTGNSGVVDDMDQFSYQYNFNVGKLSSNQLDHVNDQLSLSPNYAVDIDNQNAANYQYDEIGQLEVDLKEEISNIEWYVFNKPKKITRTGNQIQGQYPEDLEFRYGPGGNRCVKISKPWSGNAGHDDQDNWTYTYYVSDGAGNILATYQRSFEHVVNNEYKDKLALTEHTLYGSKRAGLRQPGDLQHEVDFTSTLPNGVFENSTYSSLPDYSQDHLVTGSNDQYAFQRALDKKKYELTNHLSNVLETVSDRRLAIDDNNDLDVDHYLANVKSFSDYYPFGMQMPDRNGSSPDYRYGFQGQEIDQEWLGGAVSFKYRVHDARLGRFFSVDPLSFSTPHNSPYSFSENEVIAFVEYMGLQKVHYSGTPSISQRAKNAATKTTKSTANTVKKRTATEGNASIGVDGSKRKFTGGGGKFGEGGASGSWGTSSDGFNGGGGESGGGGAGGSWGTSNEGFKGGGGSFGGGGASGGWGTDVSTEEPYDVEKRRKIDYFNKNHENIDLVPDLEPSTPDPSRPQKVLPEPMEPIEPIFPSPIGPIPSTPEVPFGIPSIPNVVITPGEIKKFSTILYGFYELYGVLKDIFFPSEIDPIWHPYFPELRDDPASATKKNPWTKMDPMPTLPPSTIPLPPLEKQPASR